MPITPPRLANMMLYTSVFLMVFFVLNIDYRLYATTPDLFSKRAPLIPIEFYFSLSALILISAFLPTRLNKPSDLALHIQLAFPLIPMLAMYARYALPSTYIAACLVAFSLMATFSQAKISPPRVKEIRALRLSPVTLARGCFTLTTLTIAYIISMGGLSYFNLSFAEVYNYRMDAQENLHSGAGYLLATVTKVIIPSLATIGLLIKRYRYAISAIFFSIILFGLTSHKAILFYPLISITIFSFFIRFKPYMIGASLAVALILSLIALSFRDGAAWVFFLLVDRTILIPAAINYIFSDWFSLNTNPFVYWSDSRISLGLLDYPYPLNTTALIGLHYFGSEKIIANTGWLGSGFANAGHVGVLLYGVIMGLILAALNKQAQRLGTATVLSVSFSALLSPMLSTDLPNGILTHGLLCTFVVLLLLREKPANRRPL